MTRYSSPLRYPGGKSRLAGFIADLIILNQQDSGSFYELYAGGAGASLRLLFGGLVEEIILNDLDYHIYAFWSSVLNHTEDFVCLVERTPVDMQSWGKSRMIYSNPTEYSELDVGFSTFFLNRCNRSGILSKAGPIGGKAQTGRYKIDVRFNKRALIERIRKIAHKGKRIRLHNRETIGLLVDLFKKEDQRTKRFIFLDPPYYVQGKRLYMNSYTHEDHERLAILLSGHRDSSWLLTYDNSPEIDSLYSSFRRAELPMNYTLQTKRASKEIMIFSDDLTLPRTLRVGSKSRFLELV